MKEKDKVNLYDLALRIAIKAHEGQKDKSGHEYIMHPICVAERCSDPRAKIVALLHDTIEDTEVTVSFILHVCQFRETGGEAAFGSVNKEMCNKFRQNKQQQQFPRHSKNQQTHSYQQRMDTCMKQNRPYISSVCLRPDHGRRGEAEIAQIVADKKG